MKVTETIENAGYGLSGDIGGIPKNTYFTPDGRVIKAIPSMRQYVLKDKDGKVVGSGTRDANLDKGWLTVPPTEKKPYCQGCDKWHDTLKEVAKCKREKTRFIASMSKQAKKEEAAKNISLEQKVADLEAKLAKLLEVKGG